MHARIYANGYANGQPMRGCVQVDLWVTRENFGFDGLNPNNLVPATEGVAALMCVDRPKYDSYTQILEWDLAWNFTWCVAC
jgi:hypothetical protein